MSELSEHKSVADLDESDRELLSVAASCRKHAYAPYSNFYVGAAVRTVDGQIYQGCNMENASYGLTICAEVVALAQSVAAGNFQVESIAVVGGPAKGATTAPVFPCGRCRQLILEAADVSGCDVRVLAAGSDQTSVAVHRISELLPHSFGASTLNDPPRS